MIAGFALKWPEIIMIDYDFVNQMINGKACIGFFVCQTWSQGSYFNDMDSSVYYTSHCLREKSGDLDEYN